MYEAPITEITKGIHAEIDNGIFKAVIESGIHIDKEKLIKALKFDREQYDEGYKDGRKDAIKEFAERVYRFLCHWRNWNKLKVSWLFNGECEWLKKSLDNLVKEMDE